MSKVEREDGCAVIYSKPAYISTPTHTLMLSWRCLTDIFFCNHYCFFPSFHSWLGLQSDSETASLSCWFSWQLVWLVVSLPYCGVYCVYAGLGVIRSTLLSNQQKKICWCCDMKRKQWQYFQVEWWGSLLVNFENQKWPNELWALSKTHLFCVLISCVCIQYMYLFCLDRLWRKYIYFL